MRASWWRGARGEWYVVGQVVLMVLVFVGPQQIRGWPPQPLPLGISLFYAGAVLLALGGALFLAGVVHLGGNLTPLPYPRDDGTLVDRGAYAIVRHPLYGGGLIAAFGWALCLGSWLTLGYVALLFVLLDFKARREERWLEQKYAGYAAYRRRVRKLVPFLY